LNALCASCALGFAHSAGCRLTFRLCRRALSHRAMKREKPYRPATMTTQLVAIENIWAIWVSVMGVLRTDAHLTPRARRSAATYRFVTVPLSRRANQERTRHVVTPNTKIARAGSIARRCFDEFHGKWWGTLTCACSEAVSVPRSCSLHVPHPAAEYLRNHQRPHRIPLA
jgi:hypothetical protein